MKPTAGQLLQTIKQLIRTAKQHLLFYSFFMGLFAWLVVGLFLGLFVWICVFVVDRWGHG